MIKKTKTPKVAEIHEAPAAEPKTAVAGELAPIQEQVADLVGDILLRGGHPDEVDSIIWSAMTHHWRLFETGGCLPETSKVSERAEAFARREFETWKRRLIKSWPDREAQKIEIEPNTVTEYVRRDVRGALELQFGLFLGNATPEELCFMESVFTDHNCSSTHQIDAGELEIANSFEREISRGVRWVRVPHKIRDKVVAFVEMLTPEDAL